MSRPIRVGSRHGRSDEGDSSHHLGGVPPKELARECGLSVGHFSHAFQGSLGATPHQGLIEQPIALFKAA